MSKPENPSAFPEICTDVKEEHNGLHHDTYSYGGMTLRDFLAAKSLAGIRSGRYKYEPRGIGIEGTLWSSEHAAELAYKDADAMLAKRSK